MIVFIPGTDILSELPCTQPKPATMAAQGHIMENAEKAKAETPRNVEVDSQAKHAKTISFITMASGQVNPLTTTWPQPGHNHVGPILSTERHHYHNHALASKRTNTDEQACQRDKLRVNQIPHHKPPWLKSQSIRAPTANWHLYTERHGYSHAYSL